jgi:hypothetical protein
MSGCGPGPVALMPGFKQSPLYGDLMNMILMQIVEVVALVFA